jgi:hypothetical protein
VSIGRITTQTSGHCARNHQSGGSGPFGPGRCPNKGGVETARPQAHPRARRGNPLAQLELQVQVRPGDYAVGPGIRLASQPRGKNLLG